MADAYVGPFQEFKALPLPIKKSNATPRTVLDYNLRDYRDWRQWNGRDLNIRFRGSVLQNEVSIAIQILPRKYAYSTFSGL